MSTDATGRPTPRTQFYAAILRTAVTCGYVRDWANMTAYTPGDMAAPGRLDGGNIGPFLRLEPKGNEPFPPVHDRQAMLSAGESGFPAIPVDLRTIRRGWNRYISADKSPVGIRAVRATRSGNFNAAAVYVDGEVADQIIQLGVFGTIHYPSNT